jgi:hypothetical protein
VGKGASIFMEHPFLLEIKSFFDRLSIVRFLYRFMNHSPGTLISVILMLLVTSAAHSQQADDGFLVQFSGVTITADSLNPVPYAHIVVKNSPRGTVSDSYGYFSFVAHIGDTVLFDALGYKPATFIIPRHDHQATVFTDPANDLRYSHPAGCVYLSVAHLRGVQASVHQPEHPG